MKKRTIKASMLIATAIVFTSCGGEKEAETSTASGESGSEVTTEEVVEVEEVAKNTFVNPKLSMMSEALTKNEFTLEELKNAIAFDWNLDDLSLVGYAFNKKNPESDSVNYSTQEGFFTSEDGTNVGRLSMSSSNEKVSVLNGQKVVVTGGMMVWYMDIYDELDKKCDIFMKSANVAPYNEGDEVVHVNDVMNLKAGQLMYLDEVKSVLTDYNQAIIAKGNIKVSCVVKSVMHSGMTNEDGSFKDAQITVQGVEKEYTSSIFKMKEVPSEDLLNELIKSKEVVTFEGVFEGSTLIDAVLLAK